MSKKRGKGTIQQLAAGALAMLSLMGAMQADAGPSKNAQKRGDLIRPNQDVNLPERKRVKAVAERPSHLGGIPLVNYWPNHGIPPQEYGERYVKRGTHKKTNKRR